MYTMDRDPSHTHQESPMKACGSMEVQQVSTYQNGKVVTRMSQPGNIMQNKSHDF